MTDKDPDAPTVVQTNLKLLLEQTSLFPLIEGRCVLCLFWALSAVCRAVPCLAGRGGWPCVRLCGEAVRRPARV
ncbi:Protein of unknown function [Gryllus bimaculatus]|nr:Protein of unknown function [Gryllus bimaculatus]